MLRTRFAWVGVFAALAWLTATLVSGDDSIASSGFDVQEELTAADFVQAALQAEGQGDAAHRAQYLKEALDLDANFAPARWQSGYVERDEKWLSIAETNRLAQADTRLAEYDKVRTSLAESPARDLMLARWCQEQKLSEQARFHWLNVLREKPEFDEALRALDLQWLNGRLVPRDKLAQQKRADYQAARNTLNANPTLKRRCEALVASWERAADEEEAGLLAKMESDLTPAPAPGVVPVLNFMIAARGQNPRNPQELERVNLEWMKVLAKDPNCTKLLVLHSIANPWESVRIAAADQLRAKPLESFVPLFLVCARFPVEFAYSQIATNGLSTSTFTLDVQGLDTDFEISHTDTRVAYPQLRRPLVEDLAYGLSAHLRRINRESGIAQHASGSATAAQRMESFVNEYNRVSADVNIRIDQALQHATGKAGAKDLRDWQKWWKQELDDLFELPPQQGDAQAAANGRQGIDAGDGNQLAGAQPGRQVIRQSVTTSNLPPDPPHSCFDGSTLVWTISGPRPIKDISPGDLVLSQDAGTGELAYKPVELVTRVAPRPMIHISVSGETVSTTRGHPFWVVGKRWTMAKQIQTSHLLHTISGPLAVDQIEEVPAAEAWYEFAYNLQVADFHTYFVGQNQILVHHLTMLSVLDEGSTVVPGL
jgi:hypothetical protein